MSQVSHKLIALGVAALLLALPAQAMAESPTRDQYDENSVTVVGDSGNDASGSSRDPIGSSSALGDGSSSALGDTLPFSGVDVAFVATVGVGLLLLGFGMRRLTGVPEEAA